MSNQKIPITIVTGFAGSGKTTLILNLIPQLRRENPGYRLALIKNEIGDVNVDSQLATAAEMTASKELLGDCICCTNIGQIEDALQQLDMESHPDRIIIETSGSAEPLKLVLEINRLAKQTGRYDLDGIISVIDAENWSGYASTSFTAKLQAQQTDLIIINKWESLSERDFDIFLDRLGDLDVSTPQTKSDKGHISKDLLFGLDEKIAREWMAESKQGDHDHGHDHDHDSGSKHTTEVECLSVLLSSAQQQEEGVNLPKLERLLGMAPKDEVYRIKAILYSHKEPVNADGGVVKRKTGGKERGRFILNWSFGRWTWASSSLEHASTAEPALRMSVFTAPYESTKWMNKLQTGNFIELQGDSKGELKVTRVQ